MFEVTTLGQPLEVAKTTMAAHRKDGLAGAIGRVWSRGGALGFYQGLIPWAWIEASTKGAVLLFVASEAEYHAKTFGASNFVAGIGGGMTGGLAQAYATMGFCTCMKTVEITKHKVAAAGGKPPGTMETFMNIYRAEGIRGINKGVNAVAVRQVTNWGSRFGLSRVAENMIRKSTGKDHGERMSAGEKILASGLGGGLSAWNQPIEVIRVELQSKAEDPNRPKKMNVFNAAKYIYSNNGIMGLYRGVTPRIALGVWQTICMVALGDIAKEFVEKVTGEGDISHPTIKDGWFREISDMWPGQAMTLKVNQVLHHEKSKYQDVLIFESSNHGTVLVLDNVIHYQEMIAHLALMSHPKPEKVLVVGGGDGGVLREVVKHESVKEAVLCDIDEAVPRLSEKYLPSMAVGLKHPVTKIHIEDGFKFLADRKNQFDVIITDSSDPEGPAESLFQKPYFQLLHDALTDGGVMTTQGSENQWLHLPLIERILKSCREIFPVAEYAYTTIPTYPSGQIGFLVCCKDGKRDVRKPLRVWSKDQEDKEFRYYNKEVHEASFILPTFARKMLR
ncbi:MAG: hypothetical protein Q9159_003308 [Coniocarpon cinnabarinum]